MEINAERAGNGRATSIVRGLQVLCAASLWLGTTRCAWAAEMQDVLAPAGPQAAHIEHLWHVMLVVCGVVFAAVLLAFAWALWRSPRGEAATPPDLSSLVTREAGLSRSVVSAVVASTLLLIFLVVASLFTDRALARLSLQDAVHVQVTANQWWWEARYDDPQASRMFTTANELHVPVGRPVIVTLKSNDVIHSFWVPSLNGKKDLIPGRTASMQFQADRPGTYRGQCAEFCGFQHAFMAFLVIADPPDRYEEWANHQRSDATEPQGAEVARGRDIFLTTSCAMCHTIQGTAANAQRAPDLTHVAERMTIGAGTLPNTPDNLERWIRDPQKFKPGANMPASDMSGDDLKALVAYLGSLK